MVYVGSNDGLLHAVEAVTGRELWAFAPPPLMDKYKNMITSLPNSSMSIYGVDGAVARRTGKVTNLGKILDPIADKALLGSALITLSFLGEIDWWITVLILAREIAVTLYRVIVIKNKVIAAAGSGKLKTVLQGIAIGAVLAPFEVWVPFWSFVEEGLMLVALASTLISGVQFFVAAIKK
jgi:CDP-diacylglycerol--glycerol-3-phosphate 3-phosphatidyltransferase